MNKIDCVSITMQNYTLCFMYITKHKNNVVENIIELQNGIIFNTNNPNTYITLQ